jgi:transposase
MPRRNKQRNKQRQQRPPAKHVKLKALEQLNLHAAGIDIGTSEIYVAVPEDCTPDPVRQFATFTTDLHALADWLSSCGVTTVAMESTGIYWVPLYEILAARGVEVFLVNARHLKNVSGRKSDILDCQWLQQLHTYGLLRTSFRPPADICVLRTLTRQREMLVRQRATHILHMQKALHLMNLQLDNVLSDITGATGMAIIHDILAGNHDPVRLATHRDSRCKRTEAELAKALTGHYKDEQLFALKQAVDAYEFFSQQLAECDHQIHQHYTYLLTTVDQSALDRLPPTLPKHRRLSLADNATRIRLFQLVGFDLTAIDGIGLTLAQTVVAEIGTDITPWPTVKHFASWLGLSPNNLVSGGKVLASATNQVASRLNLALRQAAQALAKTNTALGAFYRRMRAKHGSAHATVATAHKLARIIYFAFKYRRPYQDPGEQHYEQQFRQRMVNNLKRKAKDLGFTLTPLPDPQDVQVS